MTRLLLLGLLFCPLASALSGSAQTRPPTKFDQPDAVPLDRDKPLSLIAFGSCCFHGRAMPIFKTIVDAKPQLYLGLGDNIYADTSKPEVMIEKYGKLAADADWQSLRKSVPILAVWDDHDYGLNDAGAEYKMKETSQQIFCDFFSVPADSPLRKRPGVYDSVIVGPVGKRVQVLLLDTRYFRSPLKRNLLNQLRRKGPYIPEEDAKATMLGEEQWKWLEEQLRQPAELRIVVSSIQVVSEDHGWEKWANFPAERARLFKLIAATAASGVVFISGDRHLADLSVMDGGVGYPLYDLTASGLNQGAKKWRMPEANRHRVSGMPWGDHFGVIAVDWDKPDPTVKLQIRDAVGELRVNESVPLSVLKPGSLR